MENKKILPPFLDLLKETWSDMEKSFSRLAKISSLIIVAALILMIPVSIVLAANINNIISNAAAFLIILIIAVAFVAVCLVVNLALAHSVATGEKFWPAVKFGFKNLKSIAFATVIMSFISGGLSIMGILPGLASVIWFMFVTFIIVSGDSKGLAAITKSKEYVRGYGWSIFGKMLLLCLVILPIFIILSIPGMVNENLYTISSAISRIIQIVVVTPFSVLFIYRLFKELKERKPGLEGFSVTYIKGCHKNCPRGGNG